MAVVAANKTDQPPASSNAPPSPAEPVFDPQLLMAARQGDSERLKELLWPREEEEVGLQHDAYGMAEVEAAAASEAVIVEVVPRHRPAPAAAAPPPPPDGATTLEGDTLLHVVAACGDGEEFLHCAKMIAREERKKGGAAAMRWLLLARNNKGSTPLHCAAGAGNAGMISCLVDLADEAAAMEMFVRMQNECGETALHQAVRAAKNKLACVDKLMAVDSELACIPHENGASPLYLAISLVEMQIARYLFHTTKGELSYSGPDRRNVLHAAVSCGKAAVVLGWLKEAKTVDMQEEEGPHATSRSRSVASADLLSRLTSQRDKENGSTPLHLAASLWGLPSALIVAKGSWPGSGPSAAKLLLDANVSAVYLPDNEGLYPIHVAASAGCLRTVMVLLERCPDCATLLDGKGRTFLHAAAEKGRSNVVGYVCDPSWWWNLKNVCLRQSRPAALSSILNVQDNNGDTALHRAIQAGKWWAFDRLIGSREVRLDITNKEGMRAIDLSWSMMPSKAYYAWDYRMRMLRSLLIVGASYGKSRGDLFDEKHIAPKQDEVKMSEDLTNAAQVMAIFSVLITTVTFASAFTLPGGYRSAGDGGIAGTPVLAGSYTFDVFILSNGLAFVCSFFATSLLLYAGVPAGSLNGRFACINAAYSFMMNSGRSLVVALGFGLYVVLFPVARTIPIAVAIAMVVLACTLVKGSEGINSVLPRPMIGRSLQQWSPRAIVLGPVVFVFEHFWSYILIFGIPAIRKWARAR